MIVHIRTICFLVRDFIILVQVWEKVLGVCIKDATDAEIYYPEQLANQIIAESSTVKRIGFIGLGAMGFGMATHLLRSNFCVLGYDVITSIKFLFTSYLKGYYVFATGLWKDLQLFSCAMFVLNFLHLQSFLFKLWE